MKYKDFYVVILAGGSGTRFWPLSRKKQPKQFLKFIGDKSLFQQTIERALPLVAPENIFVVTGQDYRKIVLRQSGAYKIPPTHVLCEPSGKNTAPAILWAALRIQALNPLATMAVLPSDHLVLNVKKFYEYMSNAQRLAAAGYLVMAGIAPSRPETGYGYLQTRKVSVSGRTVFEVERFIEKPVYAKAKQFFKSDRYFWNGGMFVWKVERILGELKKYLPQVYNAFTPFVSLRGAPLGRRSNPDCFAPSGLAMTQIRKLTEEKSFERMWRKLPNISIDYGILEKTSRIATVPAGEMGWSDVGSWEALYDVSTKNKDGSVHRGAVIDLEGRGNFILSGGRLIAAVGLENFVVVDTPDALLICRRDLSQKVKDVVTAVQKDDRFRRVL